MAPSKKFTRTIKEYEIYDTVVSLKTPLFTQLEDFEAKMKEIKDDPKEVKLLLSEFLFQVGLDQSVFNQMELPHIFELIEDLCGKKKDSEDAPIA